ncbi:hypothetical protein [Collimonas sp.]|jgi:putative membrane protein|uniref:hypothetical protein n=1 Tax=Collimonas sp. TaxID=1963772 RepID=UPI0037BE4762
MLASAVVALAVRLFGFGMVRLLLPALVADIHDNKIASGLFLGTVIVERRPHDFCLDD